MLTELTSEAIEIAREQVAAQFGLADDTPYRRSVAIKINWSMD